MKKVLSITIALLCVLTLSACTMVLDVATKIKSDESATVKISVLVDKELYDSIKEMGESFGDESNAFDDDNMKPMKYDGADYYGTTVSQDFSNLDKLEAALTGKEDLGKTFSNLGADVKAKDEPMYKSLSISKKELKGVINSKAFEASDETGSYGITFKRVVSFTFPTKIIDTNGKISEDGKTVSWEIDDSDLEIYAKAASTPWGLIIGVCIAVLALIIILVLFIRKKKGNNPSDDFTSTEKAAVAESPIEMETVEEPVIDVEAIAEPETEQDVVEDAAVEQDANQETMNE